MSQALTNNDHPNFLNRTLVPEQDKWLEKKSTKTLNFLKSQNARADQWLNSSVQNDLFQEIKHRTPLNNDSYPSDLEHFSYFVRTSETLNYPQFWRYPIGKPEQATCYLDQNHLAEGEDYFDLGDIAISPDESLLAMSVDTEGDEQYQLKIIDLNTQQWLALPELPPLASDLLWSEDQDLLICYPLDDTQRPWQVLVLNIQTQTQQVIFTEPDGRFWLGCSKSRDRKTLFIESLSKQSTEYYFLPADQPYATPTLVCPRVEQHEYHVDSLGEQLFIRSNLRSPYFALFKIDKSVMPCTIELFNQQAEQLYPQSITYGSLTFEGFELFEQHLLILSREHQMGQQQFSVHKLSGTLQHEFVAPFPLASINLSDNPKSCSQQVRLELESFTQPAALYSYDLNLKKLNCLKQIPLNNTDLSQFDCQRILLPSWDGSAIPVSLIGQRDLLGSAINHQQPAPILLYTYGAYGDALDPWFSASRLSLLERGIIFAIAHIRGGSDCGEDWYKQGRLGYKENSIRDLQHCITGLIALGITNSEQLVLQGGSAAGIVLGAMYNRIPEQLKGIVAEVPFVDVLRSMSRPELPLTLTEYEEWGNPEQAEAYWRIQHWSPLDNLKPQLHQDSKNNPELWIEAGLNDPRVQYWEPTKWAYRLLNQQVENLHLRTRMDSGHAGGSGRDQSYKEIAEVQTVILQMLNKA
ncbi:oligopeptidase B [Oceanospirillum multiglobuliferum]|uniref:Peptidase S9 n=1 Tax=Oceanospirillum multiglobuliferum TaxID=64969 RepID=A0A1T4S4U9_9GAMM|nr:prolyl oligopeptidase family serine peptidase [Oceanospirillum multiglobuliferum]OPX54440.1 hypothetical protein BTE48_14070 [Oceanospirillum multiglobuliferum]SKA23253.1 oligopeptidase B [Oceanospirillum multiglobuliferum]